nr:zinc-ribbon domain-containing protein [Niallia taxi]
MTCEDIITITHHKDNNVSLKNCLTAIGSYLTSTYQFLSGKRLVENWSLIDIERDRFIIYQQYITSLKENSISNIRIDLLEEWDYEKNKGLNPEYVSISSNKKVYWVCKKKETHKWQTTVNSRTGKKMTGCPFCSNQKLDPDGTNSLATRFPEIAEEWHPTKNGDLMPSDVLPGTHKVVWWLCKKHPLHEWDVSVDSRTAGKNCPFCSGKRVNSSNSLAILDPQLAEEWHSTKNGELTPNDVTISSNKKVFWLCRQNTKHEWPASPNQRSGPKGSGCPFCTNKRIDISNCLQTTHPHLAEEWHPTKNGDLTPMDVTKGSKKKVWWLQNKNGKSREWPARIDSRK